MTEILDKDIHDEFHGDVWRAALVFCCYKFLEYEVSYFGGCSDSYPVLRLCMYELGFNSNLTLVWS